MSNVQREEISAAAAVALCVCCHLRPSRQQYILFLIQALHLHIRNQVKHDITDAGASLTENALLVKYDACQIRFRTTSNSLPKRDINDFPRHFAYANRQDRPRYFCLSRCTWTLINGIQRLDNDVPNEKLAIRPIGTSFLQDEGE